MRGPRRVGRCEARRREGFEVRVFFWALGEAVYNLYVG